MEPQPDSTTAIPRISPTFFIMQTLAAMRGRKQYGSTTEIQQWYSISKHKKTDTDKKDCVMQGVPKSGPDDLPKFRDLGNSSVIK